MPYTKRGLFWAGGHSVEDQEIKYGLSVTGIAHPDRILTNAGARVGDVLVLTKPIGTGIISTIIKANMASPELEQKVVRVMGTLNKTAAEIMSGFVINSCTDITGFGLLGHALEMARGSKKEILIRSKKVPLFAEALEFAGMGFLPEGSHANRNFCAKSLQVEPGVDEVLLDVLADAQTSGGLLISTPDGEQLCNELKEHGVNDARIVGTVVSDHEHGIIRVV